MAGDTAPSTCVDAGDDVVGGHGLMLAVGVIEIIAGLLVAFKPRIGAYVVAFWLWGIIINCCSFRTFSTSRYATLAYRSARWRSLV